MLEAEIRRFARSRSFDNNLEGKLILKRAKFKSLEGLFNYPQINGIIAVRRVTET